MATINNVREFVINALRLYHLLQVEAENTIIETLLNNYVSKENGKGLSTNDFTTTYMNKLDGIEAGAEVNVQSDWNVSDNTLDTYIANKPDIDSLFGYAYYDSTSKQKSLQDVLADLGVPVTL